jgi:hypothetical protein
MQRQDCAGCARVDVQRWDHVGSGQYQVPAMAADSHLYLVVTATDDHGATGTKELRLDPQLVTLTMKTRPRGLDAAVSRRSLQLVRGTTVEVGARRSLTRKGVHWVFVRWSDGGARRHRVTVWDPNVVLKAVYRRAR